MSASIQGRLKAYHSSVTLRRSQLPANDNLRNASKFIRCELVHPSGSRDLERHLSHGTMEAPKEKARVFIPFRFVYSLIQKQYFVSCLSQIIIPLPETSIANTAQQPLRNRETRHTSSRVYDS